MQRDLRDHGLLLHHLKQASKTGEFTLASGKKSDWFLDCREVTTEAVGLRLVAGEILELRRKWNFNVRGAQGQDRTGQPSDSLRLALYRTR